MDRALHDIISGAGGGGCFLAGTLVLTESGYISIENILVGDTVISFDDKGILHSSKVLEVNTHNNKDVWEYHIWGKDTPLYATPNHWVLTSDNSFCELGKVTELISLVDVYGLLRPLTKSKFFATTTVYNLIVEDNHTYIANNIRVHNGGGGGKGASHTPVEASDNLKSTAKAKVLDLISEGEIVGLVTGDERSIYLNDTPVKNADGSYNFTGFNYTFRTGTPNQDYIPGFSSVQVEKTGPGEFKKSITKAVTINSPIVDRVIATIELPGLVKYESNGDIVGSTVEYQLEVKKNGSTIVEVINQVLTGKTTSGYRKSHTIILPRTSPSDYFTITAIRVTDDSSDSKVQNRTNFYSYTELTDAKLRYPNSALCGIELDSEQFNTIPTRGYHVQLLKIRVPSNYSPTSRNYSGIWDGTFTPAVYCNNPAWVFYDLVTNERYGLGEYISSSMVDKWSLYTIAQYCDEFIPNGYGGMEPRFTINTYLQTREDAIKLLTDLASAFRGMVYYGNGTVTLSQDASTTSPVLQFSSSNVLEGTFVYSGASRKVIHTAALVTWNDPDSLFKQRIEYVEDREAIERYGYNPTEIVAFGCTSRGQAHRVGKWILYTERVESNVVVFKASIESAYLRPGDLIKVADNNRTGLVIAGRILQVNSSTSITLDRSVYLSSSYSYSIRLTNIDISSGTPVFTTTDHSITNSMGDHTVITITTPLSAYITPNTVWSLVTSELAEELYRLISIKETDTVGVYELTGILHNPSKYNFIENNVVLEDRVYTALNKLPSVVTGTTLSSGIYYDSTGTISPYINIEYNKSEYAAYYTIHIRKPNDNWQLVSARSSVTSNTIYSSYIVDNTYYDVKVTPYNIVNKSGPSETIFNQYVSGKLEPPSDVPWLFIDGNHIRWGSIPDIDLAGYRIKIAPGIYNNNWNSGIIENSSLITNTDYILTSYNGMATIMVKAVDTSGIESNNPAIITSNIDADYSSNVVHTIDLKALGFPGTINSGDISATNLVSPPSSSALMFNAPTASMFTYSGLVQMYPGTSYDSIEYYTNLYTFDNYISKINTNLYTTIYFNYTLYSGISFYLEYTTLGNNLFWSGDSNNMWNTDPNTLAYYIELPIYVPYTNSGINLYSGKEYKFRIRSDAHSSIQTILTQLELIVDMPDIVYSYNDIIISSAGTRIAASIGNFTNILSVNCTLQTGGGSAVTVKVIDKDILLGPLIQCFDSSGTGVAGIVDIIMKGY